MSTSTHLPIANNLTEARRTLDPPSTTLQSAFTAAERALLGAGVTFTVVSNSAGSPSGMCAAA